MNAGQLAALIAAVFFAGGVCVAGYALLKVARLASEATRYVSGMHQRIDVVIDQAHAAIDRTNEQLDRTDAITSNMTDVTANVAKLTEQVSALAALGRALAAGPVGKAAAVTYGVRRAVGMRRSIAGDRGGGREVIAAPAISAPGGRAADRLDR